MAEIPGGAGAEASIASAASLLSNGDFESGDVLPFDWTPDVWASGATFVWDDTQAHSGSWSAKISSATANDARFLQDVAVQPNTDYRLSGWIKTQDVAHTSESVDAGANLSLYGTYTRTPALTGTNDWTQVSLDFNSGSSSYVAIAARLGYWSGTTTGTAWFDQLTLVPLNPPPAYPYAVYLPLVSKPPCETAGPSWKLLVNVYQSTDFTFSDASGSHHFVAEMSQAELDKISYAVSRFVNTDIPVLDSCYMRPTLTIRYPSQALSALTPEGCSDYAPAPSDVASDRDPAFDSVISIWDGSGTDLVSGESMSIEGCSWAWGMGTGQTYDAIDVDAVQYLDRNVFKHEWGHSITFYYDAAGTAPKPAVDNHINDTTNRYVNCHTGDAYVLQDESDINPIPNSIYNNESGFTHDYYSGQTAQADLPSTCLGITAAAWSSGGPVTSPAAPGRLAPRTWHNPSDDVITTSVPYR